MSALSRSVRPLRATLVVAVIAGSAIGLAAPPAGALASGVFVACGYSSPVPVTASIGHGCTTLAAAITSAEAYSTLGGAIATIDMMPGDYCPIDIPNKFDSLHFVGIGVAGIDTSGDPVSFSGPEAGLTTFIYDATGCGDTVPTAMIQNSAGYFFDATFSFENLTVDGTSGPDYGMYFTGNGANVVLRDVLIQNESITGLYYVSSQSTGLAVDNSAFLDNATGANLTSANLTSALSVDESTVADNTSIGLEVNGAIDLDNDAISHNTNGLDITSSPSTNSTVQLANSIVGDNTTNDCEGPIDGLEPNGASGGNGNNLIGTTCNTPDNTTDIQLTDTVPAVADNGGPTPTILPPSQAQNAAVPGYCNSTGSDQREYVATAGSPCDIGAVNTSASGTVVPSSSIPSPVDFGTVPTNSPAGQSLTISNAGGDIMGISQVSLSGDPAFTITSEDCTHYLVVHQEGSYCNIGITAAPTTQTAVAGTLTIDTTGGLLTIELDATGGPPASAPGAPTAVHGRAGNRKVTLSWSAPGNDGGQPVDSYAVRYSGNGGSTWKDGPTTAQTTANVGGLTNGKAYVFEVAATNDFGTGGYSTMSAAVTPHVLGDASKVAAPKKQAIKYGGTATLRTTLTDVVSKKPIVGVPVFLLSRPATGGLFIVSGKATTDTHGAAHASVRPSVNRMYKWSYAGSSRHSSTTSALATVTVAQVVVAANFNASVKHDKIDEIYGTVAPKETGQKVTLQRLVSGKWTTLTVTATIKLQTLPNGRKTLGYVLSYTPTAAGHQTLRVSRAATKSNAAGVSKRLTLTVT